MFVCICHGVSDSTIETAVENGATTFKQIKAELKVATQCGKCCQCAKQVLNNKLLQIAEPHSQVA